MRRSARVRRWNFLFQLLQRRIGAQVVTFLQRAAPMTSGYLQFGQGGPTILFCKRRLAKIIGRHTTWRIIRSRNMKEYVTESSEIIEHFQHEHWAGKTAAASGKLQIQTTRIISCHLWSLHWNFENVSRVTAQLHNCLIIVKHRTKNFRPRLEASFEIQWS